MDRRRIGIGSLLAQLPFETMRWIATAVFGIALRMLALMLDRGRYRPTFVRSGQMLLWLAAVLILPLWLELHIHAALQTEAASLSLDAYHNQNTLLTGYQNVTLPAGTQIPVEIELGGDIFVRANEKPELPSVWERPIELMMNDGKLTGEAQLGDEPWQLARQVRWISIPWLKAEISLGKGLVVSASLIVQLRKH